MTSNQAKRLKEAGFPCKPSAVAGVPMIPTEKEMMEWLRDKTVGLKIHVIGLENEWEIIFETLVKDGRYCSRIRDADLTECLVQACCAVAKGRDTVMTSAECMERMEEIRKEGV